MKYIKIIWLARALFYKLFFKRIGFFSYIGEPLYIGGYSSISIGNKTRIMPGLRIEAIENGEICIGSNVVIEQNAHIISWKGKLNIGDNVTIAPNVFITNVNHDYRDVTKSVMEQPLIFRETQIGEGCFIGYGATIQAGTILGKHCIVGSNTVLKGKFPDYSVLVGNPVKVIKRYDVNIEEWKNEN